MASPRAQILASAAVGAALAAAPMATAFAANAASLESRAVSVRVALAKRAASVEDRVRLSRAEAMFRDARERAAYAAHAHDAGLEREAAWHYGVAVSLVELAGVLLPRA